AARHQRRPRSGHVRAHRARSRARSAADDRVAVTTRDRVGGRTACRCSRACARGGPLRGTPMTFIETVFGTLVTLLPNAAPKPIDVATAPTLSDADLLAQADAAATSSETIEVASDAPAESASSVHIGRDQLRFRSHTQASDVLRQVPGLVV